VREESNMNRSTARWLLFLSTAPVWGCSSEGEGPVTVLNQTPYYLHFLHPDESTFYLPPGEGTTITADAAGQNAATFIVAPGQDAKGRADVNVDCCTDEDGTLNCGTVVATWDQDQLSAESSTPTCYTGGGGGSCPYVYSGTGGRFVLEGETLVGALNRGAQRSDPIVLPSLRAEGGIFRVRVATRLEEVDYVDALSLEVIDHPPASVVVRDDAGNLHVVLDSLPPLRAVDARGHDRLPELGSSDQQSWEADDREALVDGKIRDSVVVEFPRPAGASKATLLLRGRGTSFVQDAYHAYVRQFGPGFTNLMRLTSFSRWYRPAIEHFLDQLGLEVSIKAGDGWTRAAGVRPIGPAATQDVAVTLTLPPPDASGLLSVRLAAMPGSWLVDSVKVSYRAFREPEFAAASAAAARLVQPSGSEEAVDLAAILREDQHYQRLVKDEELEVDFPAPTDPRVGWSRTGVLRIAGYYQDAGASTKPWIHFGPLAKALHHDNSFARFVLARLSWRDELDTYAVLGGVERSSR
jgi:hypothetical protein